MLLLLFLTLSKLYPRNFIITMNIYLYHNTAPFVCTAGYTFQSTFVQILPFGGHAADQ